MDGQIYSESIINKFREENLFFRDPKLKKYYERNLQRDLGKFRKRLVDVHKNKSFEKMIYVLVTDSIRDIILKTIGELTSFLSSSGDLVISGGEAFNMYVDFKDRIVTSDIDAKFVPRIPMNEKYFGKLQAVKLLLWDKLGQLAKRLNTQIKNRVMNTDKKLSKYLGVNFKTKGPYVTRRYTLIKKKKTSTNNKPNKGDIFIDVELFALDLNIRYFSPESGRIEDMNLGGILDIPFMRPREFGYEVSLTKRKGIVYKEPKSNKLINDKRIYIASKEFLIEDIYLMQKLKLRPEKKEKDRQRLVRLSQLVDKRIKSSNNMEEVFKKILPKITSKKRHYNKAGTVSMKRASRVNPYKYNNYTSKPVPERLSKQIVHGLKPVLKNTNVNGYTKSSGNKRFNTQKLKWIPVKNRAYVKDEFPLRTENAKPLPKNLNMSKTLYGHNPRRNKWVPRNILDKASTIPFVGLKK